MFSYSDGNKANFLESKSTNNLKVDSLFVVEHIRCNKNKALIDSIRKDAKHGFESQKDPKKIKLILRPSKLKLDYFLYSGYCKKHHSNNNLEYNSFIQVDIDFKFSGGYILANEVKENLKQFNFVFISAISPSGYGVRAIVKTSNFDKNKHLETSKQLISHLSEKLEIETKCFDVLGASQPSFETYDPTCYFNLDCSNFIPNFDKIQRDLKNVAQMEFKPCLSNVYNEFELAVKYAIEKTGQGFVDGNKYLFVNRFSICANLLGIDQKLAREYVRLNYFDKSFFDGTCNAFESPYLSYGRFFGIWKYKVKELRESTLTTKIQANKGQRLNDVIDINNLNNLKNSLIIAPTGTGKTYWISGLKHKRIIIVPTAKMVEQVAKEYNATPFYAKAKGDILHSDYIVTTYNSFAYVVKILDSKGLTKNFIAYIDEFHNTTTSTSKDYQLKQLTQVVELLPKFKYWIAVTATQLYNFHPYFQNTPKYEISIPKAAKNAYFVDATNPVKSICDLVKMSVRNNRFAMVLHNNTSDTGSLHTIKTLLANVEGVAYFNSRTKDSHYFKELSNLSKLNPNIKALVCTTVIKEGTNINNNYEFDIIISGQFHPIEVEQFCNRPRKPKAVNIYILRPKQKDNSNKLDVDFNSYKYAQLLKKQCNNRILELNNYDPYCYESQLLLERKVYNSINYLPLKNIGTKYQIDWLNFNNHIFKVERKIICENDKMMLDYLAKFNINIKRYIDLSDQIDSLLIETLKTEKKERKSQKQSKFYDILDNIDSGKTDLKDVTNFQLDTSKSLTKLERQTYKKYLYLKGVHLTKAQSISILNDVGYSDSKFNSVKQRLSIYQLKSSIEYMGSNRRLSVVLKAIFHHFKSSDSLTIDVIKERLKYCLSIDSSFDMSIFENTKRNDKVLNILRMFYDTKKVQKRNGKDRFYEYKLSSIDFNIDLSNEMPPVYSSEYIRHELSKALKAV